MSTLYSLSHQEKNVVAHQINPMWGINDNYHFSFTPLDSFIKLIQPKSIIDYGCGKGFALDQLKLKFPDINMVNYDPFYSTHSTLPTTPCELVICYNVLQDVELNFLDQVIEQIYNLSTKNILLSMNFYESKGQTSVDWWRNRLAEYNIITDARVADHQIYPIHGVPMISGGYNCWISKKAKPI
jgi:hypothetical protein